MAASALIKVSARFSGTMRIGIIQDPYVGGAARFSGRVNVFIREGVLIQAQFKLTGSISVTYTV